MSDPNPNKAVYYEYLVYDAEGFWGGIRRRADSPDQAAEACRAHLDAQETAPNGSLIPPYRLVLDGINGVSLDRAEGREPSVRGERDRD